MVQKEEEHPFSLCNLVLLAKQVCFLSYAEAQRDIHQKATDDLADAGLEGIHLSFYLTSIYDHSIFEVRHKQGTLVQSSCVTFLCV